MFSGDRLAELRKDKGLLQKELADLLGVSVQAIGTYERGKHDPDIKLLQKMAEFFDVSADYLLELTDEYVSYDRNRTFDKPKGFPEEAVPIIKGVISTIAALAKQQNTNHKSAIK